MRIFLKHIAVLSIFGGLFFSLFPLNAQQTQIYRPRVSRILFVVDCSGSMKQKWNENSKFELARELLFKLVDSVERKNPNVEFAVRALGFQFPYTQRDCKDSKLLVPFGKNNASKIANALNKITPQGMSPIAYSIAEGAKDFPPDTFSLNSIVLITDGEETCGGDPCKTSGDLAAHRVSLKPFIVGMNVDTAAINKYKCVGAFFDTKDKASFYNAIGVIIKQTLNTTTAQINLLDANGEPTVTNIPFTLYDHFTGAIEYNFVHTMNEKGNPDTLYLDPVGVYDLELHTFPPIRKENIELVPGKHNIIALDASFGRLSVECISCSIASNDAQILVREKPDVKSILNVQDINGQDAYLAGKYRLEILTTPETIIDTSITAFADDKPGISNYGTLSMIAGDIFLAGVYTVDKGGLMQMVEHFDINGKTGSRRLQPGQYLLVYKPKNNYHSESTRSQQFTIEEGKTTVLTL